MTSAFPSDWTKALEAVKHQPGIVVLLGASDRGKTTWMRTAVTQLSTKGPVAVIDADIGQSSIGPPATVALSIVQAPYTSETPLIELPPHALSFVGSTSPIGHLLQTLVATQRLIQKARHADVRYVLVDTTGLIGEGVGFHLKVGKIDLIRPEYLITFQRARELEPLLSVVEGRPGMSVHRLTTPPFIRNRSPAERAEYRAGRWTAYFAGAPAHTLSSADLRIIPPLTGRHPFKSSPGGPLLSGKDLTAMAVNRLVVGLNDVSNDTLGVGLIEAVDAEGSRIYVRTPLEEIAGVHILQMGSLYIDELGHTRPLRSPIT